MGCCVVRGIRGATTVSHNSAEEIIAATKELLEKMAEVNQLDPAVLISIIFSATPDLNAAFPAAAARELGWTAVPLFDTVEIDVPGALPRCIRVLMHVQMEQKQKVQHIYLREARQLRPDLVSDNT
ncbi:MAG: chorismate mutase [Dethiobacteraceae bacterium]|mgnify:CR=1 FL=1|nr:chorismate mutase [Bacillota bacterium]